MNSETLGAIRRAAEVARYYDREAARPPSIDIWGDALEASHYHDWAHAVRLAIRAAIGSPKA